MAKVSPSTGTTGLSILFGCRENVFLKGHAVLVSLDMAEPFPPLSAPSAWAPKNKGLKPLLRRTNNAMCTPTRGWLSVVTTGVACQHQNNIMEVNQALPPTQLVRQGDGITKVQ